MYRTAMDYAEYRSLCWFVRATSYSTTLPLPERITILPISTCNASVSRKMAFSSEVSFFLLPSCSSAASPSSSAGCSAYRELTGSSMDRCSYATRRQETSC